LALCERKERISLKKPEVITGKKERKGGLNAAHSATTVASQEGNELFLEFMALAGIVEDSRLVGRRSSDSLDPKERGKKGSDRRVIPSGKTSRAT